MIDRVVHLEVRGVVQGVGYRWSMAEQARRLGMHGWVRNWRDGSVEATIAGPADAVGHVIEWARTGPDPAVVQSVEVIEGEGTFSSFQQLPTE